MPTNPVILRQPAIAILALSIAIIFSINSAQSANVGSHPPAVAHADVTTTPTYDLHERATSATVTGHLVMVDTKVPLSNTCVLLKPVSFADSYIVDATFSITNSKGKFEFHNVQPGRKKLILDYKYRGKLGLAPPLPSIINLADHETTDVTLYVYPGRILSGRIFDKFTSAPIANAIVYGGANRSIETTSDVQGHYQFSNVVADKGTQILLSADSDTHKMESRNDGFISVTVPDGPNTEGLIQDIPMIPKMQKP